MTTSPRIAVSRFFDSLNTNKGIWSRSQSEHLEEGTSENHGETFMSMFEVLVSRIDRTESAISNYRGSLRNDLLPFSREMDITQIRSHHIISFYHEVLSKKSLRARTQANDMAFLSSLLMAAWQEFDVQKKLPTFPRIDVPDDNDWGLIDARTQDLIMSAIRSFGGWAAILFSVGQLTMPVEGRALKLGDVDFTTHSIWIRRTFSKRNQSKSTTNTGRKQALPLGPEVEQHQSFLCQGKTPDAFVFSPDGEVIMPWGQNVFRRTWERECNRLYIEGVALYPGTRHSSATQATDRGVDSRIMKDMLGHGTFKMTDRYAKIKTDRPSAALRPDVSDRMGDQLRRVLETRN